MRVLLKAPSTLSVVIHPFFDCKTFQAFRLFPQEDFSVALKPWSTNDKADSVAAPSRYPPPPRNVGDAAKQQEDESERAGERWMLCHSLRRGTQRTGRLRAVGRSNLTSRFCGVKSP